MLVWASIVGGLAFVTAVLALVAAMVRAERRARLRLFQNLGLTEETVELLMTRNGDVLGELALVRIAPSGAPETADPEAHIEPAGQDGAPLRRQATIRLVHPVAGEPRTPGSGRSQPYSDRR